MLQVYYYNHNGPKIIDIQNICESDAEFFGRNKIKVSMEELAGEIIVYGCPFTDESEESEVIVFSSGRNCIDTMSDLADECRRNFGVE